ncbi:MAG: hypothetical protein ACXVPQ_04895 [Bacteroidia bacterium]
MASGILGIALLLQIVAKDFVFVLNFFDFEIRQPYPLVFLELGLYLLVLGLIYYAAYRAGLQSRKWLVVSHYAFVILFLMLFLSFCLFDIPEIQRLISWFNLSLATAVICYALLLSTDIVIFFIGLLLLMLNFFSFKKTNKT